MELQEKADELLETMWIYTEERKQDSVAPDDLAEIGRKPIEQLLKAGYVELAGGRLKLTGRGRLVARNIVRRHRLAERLLADVLGAGGTLMHEKACKFEHLLDHGLDESICSLLGHPKICPHGTPIPPGRCCRQERAPAQKVVSPLSQLNPAQRGKVAYVYAPESNQLQKLMAMGILPGAPISLIQNFPSYVFKIGQAQFAVDKEIADSIYVRLVEPEISAETEPERLSRRRRWQGLRPRFGRWRSRGGG